MTIYLNLETTEELDNFNEELETEVEDNKEFNLIDFVKEYQEEK